ncbi:Brix domain family protein [Leishmania donovani]|nr:Brix domain family protein [Leishmania donovani]
MTSSQSALLRTLHDAITHTLRNADEVAALVDAAVQLSSLRYRPLASSWDLPKLLSSALRTQINTRMRSSAAVASSVSPASLCRVLAAAWRLCPLVTLPLPRAAADGCTSPTSIALLLSLSDEDVERVGREISSLENAPCSSNAAEPSARDTATAVVTSLLLCWHMLCAEAQEVTAESEETFRRVSATVWRCLQRWAAADGCDEMRRALLKAWVGTVLRRALLCTSGLCVMSAVTLLDTVVPPSIDTTTPMAFASCNPSNSGLSELWARLHLRVCQHVMEDMRARQAAFSAEWSRSVVPVLTRAFAQEPPLLSPSFTNVIQFAEPLDTSLGELMRVVHRMRRCALGSSATSQAVDLASCVSADTLTPLLCLARLSRRMAEAGVPIAPFATASTYRAYVAPLIAVSLRWGLVAEACVLLDWFASALDDRGTHWQRRLHRILDSLTPDASSATPGNSLTRLHGQEGGLPYFEWLEELQCTSSTALDVLATCDDVRQLRPVCDALLRHRPAEWATEVLQDPFAPFFILSGVTRLIEALLQARDAPLARFYVTLLGRLLPRCPCPTQLQVLLRVVHRLATVLTTTHLSAADYAAPDSLYGAALARWQRLKTALEHVDAELSDADGADGSRHVDWPRQNTAGLAWDARKHLQCFCAPRRVENVRTAASAQITPQSPAVALGTVVVLCYVPAGSQSEGEGLLWLRRTRTSATCPSGEQRVQDQQLLSLTARCPVGGALRSCAAEMADVMNRNRAQLMRGNASAVGETGRCLDSQGSRELAASTSCACQQASDGAAAPIETDAQRQRRRKEAWWCERFELDDRIGRVAASMQDALGAAHMLLLGYPSSSLGGQLQTLAARFACECVRLRGASHCPPVEALQHVTLQVLAAAPYLWKDKTPPRGQTTCWYGPRNARSCACCMQTVKRAQRMLLEAVTALGQLVTAATAAAMESSLSCALASEPANVEECWLALLADRSVQGVVEEMVPAVLNAYYRELTPDAAANAPRDDEERRHHHADLLLVSREHVYLVLDGELHALPWEALGVCQERSVSRVPSLEYLKYCSTDASAVSLQRLLVYRDDAALQHGPSSLTDLITQHPHWEVVYGETLQAATAAARDGSSAVTSPLMRRLLSQCEAASDRIDTYVYAGHKGGEHVAPRGALYDWIPAAAGTPPTLVLLMGCSSARMQASALYDCFGLPFAYLSAGVSCVLGCLWDVTDADIDRLTGRFLQVASQTTADGEGITVGECLAVARRACKLQYLTGMATVFYGVNCYVTAAREDNSKDKMAGAGKKRSRAAQAEAAPAAEAAQPQVEPPADMADSTKAMVNREEEMVGQLHVQRAQTTKKMTNRQKMLVLGARSMTSKDRHLLLDLRGLMPHSREHPKIGRTNTLGDDLIELCGLHQCNSVMFVEPHRNDVSYLWIGQAPSGPSIKMQINNVHTADEIRMAGNCLKYSRPLLHFDRDFELHPHLRVAKSLLHMAFNTPRYHPKSKPFVDRIMSFLWLDNHIWVRNYQIVPTSPPSLMEIGPRFTLEPVAIFNGCCKGSVLWKSATARPPTEQRRDRKLRRLEKQQVNEVIKEKSEKHKALHPAPSADPLDLVFRD